MKIDIITIFPNQIDCFIKEGLFKRAAMAGVEIEVHDLRKWTTDKHKTVDDRPFGGGPGMILKVGPIFKAVEEVKSKNSWVVLTAAKGKQLTPDVAKELSKKDHIVLIAGHYEGTDERVNEHIADEEISIGNYVLSGGELPTLVIMDALLRHIPGVLGNPDSLKEESFEEEIESEYPQYTRPVDFNGWKVPEVLVSGNHKDVEVWRKGQSKVK